MVSMKRSRGAGAVEFQLLELQSLALALTSSLGTFHTQNRILAARAAKLMLSSLVRKSSWARFSRRRWNIRTKIRIAWNRKRAAALRKYKRYRSHNVGCR